jgi:hypothetical protein
MGNQEMPNLTPAEENKSEVDPVKLSFEEMEDSSNPETPENAEELLEQLSVEDKKQVEKITAEMPLSAKAEIMQAVAEQVKLFKELGAGLKEKIDWSKLDKKKVMALSAYAMISVMGGFAANAEAAEDDQEGGEALTADFVKDIVNNAVINDLKTMDNLSNAEGQEFMDTAYELANAMDKNGVQNPQMKFDMAIEGMVDYITWAKGEQGTQVNADFSSGLQEIFEVYSAAEAEVLVAETSPETFTDLPESKTLEFGEHISSYEQSKAQEYYDYTVELMDEGADEFEGWKLKYGHKANFGEFQEAVGQWLDGLKGELESVENYATNPESTLKISMNGNMSAETFAEMRIDMIGSQVNLRTIDEKFDDAFKEF